jgi:23S rRNA pseudouridine1911/1915/1917 synthase
VDHESDGTISFEIPGDVSDIRLDVFLSSRPIDLSRSRLQALIKKGDIRVNGLPSKAGYRLKPGDTITVLIPAPEDWVFEPEKVDFSIVHEDSSLIVVDKPAGLVVHPAPGNKTGTLVHGLLYHCGNLSGIGGVMRPGIVHRLDKDTSGLMVVAKTDRAHSFLAEQFKSGEIKKKYYALVHGRTKKAEGSVDLPIGRHQKKRKEMSVSVSRGRPSLTLWRRIEDFSCGFSLLAVILKTGRTHQIRVHMASQGHPVAGDTVYGYGNKWWRKHRIWKKGFLKAAPRQLLHSGHLGFKHPDKGMYVEFEAALPEDMLMLLDTLRRFDQEK